MFLLLCIDAKCAEDTHPLTKQYGGSRADEITLNALKRMAILWI